MASPSPLRPAQRVCPRSMAQRSLEAGAGRRGNTTEPSLLKSLPMGRHDAKARLKPQGRRGAAACCACPKHEWPVLVGVGAPGSRLQAVEPDLGTRAWRQQPARRRKPCNGKQAHLPQHEVKRAASTALQAAGRAAHVTVKAASPGRTLKREEMAGKTGSDHPIGFEPIAKARQLRGPHWSAASRAPRGRLHLPCLAGRSDAMTVTCMPLAASAGPLSLRTGQRNAACRRPLVSRLREIRMRGLNGPGRIRHPSSRRMRPNACRCPAIPC